MMQLARRVALVGALVAGIATGALAQGFDKVFEAYSNGKIAEAVQGFKALAGKGDARAQLHLGQQDHGADARTRQHVGQRSHERDVGLARRQRLG